ncbi:hypothetical protein [Microbacterium sp. CFBP9034]|uniref:hypothetical protein n=1 Tax=Microbacterium sp. CFBP9034 TaxID=3096540 RepID=UPI002A6B5E9C|nr:hypothetical protein [Microbacterium sp. CFBP9034]MDY0910057.1 hypothetical protein [Microbacterium sp. CFBP9034]
MTRAAKIALAASALVIAFSLAGCAAPADESEAPAEVTAASRTATPATPSTPESPSPTPTHPLDPRDTDYQATVAAWGDPIPPGLAWPAAITDLLAGRWHGNGDWSGYMTAEGVYHCMLVYAAWDAYFVDNDPIASKELAAHADATMPDMPYPNTLTRDDGTIEDQALASESGICNGFVGDLRS